MCRPDPASNYMYTELTLASLFHMQYVDDIPDREAVQVPYGLSLRSTINSNPVWDELRSRGYVIATALSPWENVPSARPTLFVATHPTNSNYSSRGPLSRVRC